MGFLFDASSCWAASDGELYFNFCGASLEANFSDHIEFGQGYAKLRVNYF
jgi:hypothetical protein